MFGDSLDHVQKLLCDQAFEFAEGLLLKNRPYLFFFVGCALAENELSNIFEQGPGRIGQLFLQFFLALEVSQLGKLTAREPQELPHLVVNICPVGRGGRLFSSQQLGNIGLRNLRGGCQIPLLKTQLFQSLPDH